MSREYKKLFIINDYSKVNISKEFIDVEQFYLQFNNPRIRVRKNQNMYTLSTKFKLDNNEKIELSSKLSEKDYYDLKKISVSKILNKRRYEIRFEDQIGLYDEYYGEIDLKLISLEFFSKEEINNFKCPDYLTEVQDLLTVDKLKR